MKTNTCILTPAAVAVCEEMIVAAATDTTIVDVMSANLLPCDAVDSWQALYEQWRNAVDPSFEDTTKKPCGYTAWLEAKIDFALFLLEAHDSELAEMEQEAADAELERQLFH